MTKVKRGMVYTNDNCVGCYRCIAGCPITGANLLVVKDGKNRIEVDGNKCIHCGHCMDMCEHDAREYVDDTAEFLTALDQGSKVSLLVAPSFFLDYPQKAEQILSTLQRRGAGPVYPVAFGGDIATWLYVNYMKKHETKGIISQQCPAVVNYLERYSKEFFEHLAPIQSPMMCTAIYSQKYLGDDTKKAFIGPCIAKKDEIKDNPGYVDYNVTYRHLLESIKLSDEPCDKVVYATEDYKLGAICSVNGGMKECLERYIGHDYSILSVGEGIRHYTRLPYYEQSMKDRMPTLLCALNCRDGCVLGSGVDKKTCSISEIMHRCSEVRKKVWSKDGVAEHIQSEEYLRRLNEKFSALNPDDFIKTNEDRYIQPIEIPKDTLEDIYLAMHKDTPGKRRINCGSCGYSTCREMAEAIAFNYNRIDNCVQYERDEILRLRLTDTTTGISNVNAFDKFVQNVLDQCTNREYTAVSFSILDWDLINDRYGYASGDAAIIEFAQKMKNLIEKDEIVARQGSIHFLAMVKNGHLEKFVEAANNITLHIEEDDKNEKYTVSISAGLYRLNGEEAEIGDVITRLNIAAAAARRDDTPDLVYYDESMREETLDAMMVIKSFPDAIEKEEFVVYYQPKVNLNTLKLMGAEALVRWKTNFGIVPPGRFVPVYEKNGNIRQLDLYVLEHVCRQIREWLDNGIKPVRISSNFSKQHFRDDKVADRITEIVDRFKIPHKYIEIEFTETAYIDEHERLKSTLQSLKKAGFSSSIDDFGSGYSSLNLLQNLDFEVLKLDRAFLNLGASDKKTQKIIESIIRMAKSLDMEVVAEGVERREELEMLRRFSCDMIQGFYFDCPLPPEEFEERLKCRRYPLQRK